MIPIGDSTRRKRRRFRVVTLLLIAVNILVFLYELSLGGAVNQFIEAYGVVPAELLTGQDIPPPSPSPSLAGIWY